MALTDKLNAAYAELKQREQTRDARAAMQPIREDVLRVDAELQAIADSGVFNTIDAEVKAALLASWNVIKTAKTGFENITVKELLDWRP